MNYGYHKSTSGRKKINMFFISIILIISLITVLIVALNIAERNINNSIEISTHDNGIQDDNQNGANGINDGNNENNDNNDENGNGKNDGNNDENGDDESNSGSNDNENGNNGNNDDNNENNDENNGSNDGNENGNDENNDDNGTSDEPSTPTSLNNLADLVAAGIVTLVPGTGDVNTIGSEYKFGSITIDGVDYEIEWTLISNADSGYGMLVAKKYLPVSIMGEAKYFYVDSETRTLGNETVLPNNYFYSNTRAYLNSLDGTGYNISDYTTTGFKNLFGESWSKIEPLVGRVNVCYSSDEEAAAALLNSGLNPNANGATYQKGTGKVEKTTYTGMHDENGDYFFLLGNNDVGLHADPFNHAAVSGYFNSDAERAHYRLGLNVKNPNWMYESTDVWLRSPYAYTMGLYYLTENGGYYVDNVAYHFTLLPAMFIKI